MSGTTSITVRVPLAIRRRPGRKTVVTPVQGPGETAVQTRADPALVMALARAFRWRRMLEAGRYATVKELAAGEKINASYVSRVLRLTLLAPDIVEAALDGHAPHGLGLAQLTRPFPASWSAQREHVDLTRPPSSERKAA